MKNDASLVSKAWYALIAANTFALIVTLTANDSSYYQAGSTLNLPLVNVRVTLVQFAFIAPLLLLCGHLYQLAVFRRIKREWDALVDDQRAQQKHDLAWIVAGVLGNPEGASRSDAIETAVKRLLFFWYGPATLIYFWARCIRFHDLPLTAYHVALATIAVGVTAFITREGLRPTPATGKRKLFEALPMFLIAVLSTALGLGALTSAAWYDPGRDPLAKIGVPTTLNLSGADFSSTVHVGSDGSRHGIDFSGRDLRGANFSQAILPWANFERARLDRATFESANLQGANLVETSIADADFKSADFRNDARLAMALGPRASFKGAKAPDANFHGARLCGADFGDADISGIDLADANLTSASFVDTDMHKAGFGGSSLLNAEIGGDVDLTGVTFTQSDMCGAKVKEIVQACTPDPQHRRPQGANGWPTVCRDAYNDLIRPD